MAELAVVVPPASPPRLSHDELAAAQKETLSAPRRSYSIAARALLATLDLVYGQAADDADYQARRARTAPARAIATSTATAAIAVGLLRSPRLPPSAA